MKVVQYIILAKSGAWALAMFYKDRCKIWYGKGSAFDANHTMQGKLREKVDLQPAKENWTTKIIAAIMSQALDRES